MRIPYSRSLAALCVLFGLVALAKLQVGGIGVAGLAFFVAGTAVSRANQIARSLGQFVNKAVVAEVWGVPLPVPSGEVVVVDSVSAFGAGLLIRLRSIGDGKGRLLKVAQPSVATVEKARIEIREAAYVSWAGQRLSSGIVERGPALVLMTRPPVGTGGAA